MCGRALAYRRRKLGRGIFQCLVHGDESDECRDQGGGQSGSLAIIGSCAPSRARGHNVTQQHPVNKAYIWDHASLASKVLASG